MDHSESSVKAVFLLSVKIRLMSLLLGSFRMSFVDGQKHLESLPCCMNLGEGWAEGQAVFKASLKRSLYQTPNVYGGGRGRDGGCSVPFCQAPAGRT